MNRTAHSTLIAALALLVLLGVALVAGCSTTSSGSSATATPTTAATTTGTVVAGTIATIGTSGSSSGSGSAAFAVIAADRMTPFVPKTAGSLTLDGNANAITMKDSAGTDYSMVMGEYIGTGSATKANLLIMDSAVAKTPYKDQWGTLANVETNEGSWRSLTVKGQPGWIFHDKTANAYAEWVMAGDRFMVIATTENGSEADIQAIVNAMDLPGLAALK